ncbi:hypothetical protein B0T24DRAFT_621185, partial [Lasiosphaeria ovina]
SKPLTYFTSSHFILHLSPNHLGGAPRDWQATFGFQCHNLLQVMRQGLFWTTSNIVPEGCFYTTTADKPKHQSRWVGNVTIRLDTLSLGDVFRCWAEGKDGLHVFNYSPSLSLANINCWQDDLHPLDGSWWFWPMDSPAGGQYKESTGDGGL